MDSRGPWNTSRPPDSSCGRQGGESRKGVAGAGRQGGGWRQPAMSGRKRQSSLTSNPQGHTTAHHDVVVQLKGLGGGLQQRYQHRALQRDGAGRAARSESGVGGNRALPPVQQRQRASHARAPALSPAPTLVMWHTARRRVQISNVVALSRPVLISSANSTLEGPTSISPLVTRLRCLQTGASSRVLGQWSSTAACPPALMPTTAPAGVPGPEARAHPPEMPRIIAPPTSVSAQPSRPSALIVMSVARWWCSPCSSGGAALAVGPAARGGLGRHGDLARTARRSTARGVTELGAAGLPERSYMWQYWGLA